MSRFRRDERGGYAGYYILLFATLLVVFLLVEYFRLTGLAEEAEGYVQRGINVAMEDAMRDTERWDYRSTLDSDQVQMLFDRYLRAEIGLDRQYRKTGDDGSELWRIVIESMQVTASPPSCIVQAQLLVPSWFSFMPDSVTLNFRVSSRNIRLE